VPVNTCYITLFMLRYIVLDIVRVLHGCTVKAAFHDTDTDILARKSRVSDVRV